MDVLELLDVAQARSVEVICQVSVDHLPLASPCEGWDVRTLVNKMLTSGRLFADFARGAEPSDDLSLIFPPDLLGRMADQSSATLHDTYRQTCEDCVNAFRSSRLLGQMNGPLGAKMPIKGGIMLRITDCTVNTWDLARSIGIEPPVGDDQAQAVIEFAYDYLVRLRKESSTPEFAEPVPVPEDGSALDRLIAVSGRNPEWRQPSFR